MAEPLEEIIRLEWKRHREIRRDYEEGLWTPIGQFVNPRREHIGQDTWDEKKGQRRGKRSYDGTPLGALNTWTDGMQGAMIPRNDRWFIAQLSVPELNEIDIIRLWLQSYGDAMLQAFNRSNFYSAAPEWFRDAGSIGTATIFTELDRDEQVVVHIPVHPREIFVAENKSGKVDTVYREFEKTARQMIDEFGEDNVSQQVKDDAIDVNPHKMHKVIHAVFPNKDRIFGNILATNKKWRSVHVEEKTSDGVLRDSGFDIMPYTVWRFRKNSDEIYGYSPAADALTEIFSMNQIGKSMLMAAAKSVDPPINVPEKMRNNVRMTPHGYNYFDDPAHVISAIQTGINFPIGIDREVRLQESMEDKYRVKFFQVFIARQGEATREEILQIKDEQASLLGSQVDVLSEVLKAVFDIVADIENKLGNLPAPPPEVERIIDELGAEINIVFTGPLAQAQRRVSRLQPIRTALTELEPVIAIFPEVTDKIDGDELAEFILESGSFPQEVIRSDAAVAQIRKDRAEAEQLQQQLEIAQGAAQAYPGLTKSPEEGSAAQAALEVVGAA